MRDGDQYSEGLSKPEKLYSILWLMNQFPRYRNWSMEDLNRYVFPPVELGQCHLFCRDEKLIGYISWAFMDPAISSGVMTTRRGMKPEHWKCGNELWIVELISLPGNIRYIVDDLKGWFPGDAKRVRNWDLATVRGRYGKPIA